MAIRRVTEEFEARLAPAGAQNVSGKIERKTYGNGEHVLHARIRDLDDVALDYPLQLFIGDSLVGNPERSRNKAELRLSSGAGQTVPTVTVGDNAEIRSGELILARGVFVED